MWDLKIRNGLFLKYDPVKGSKKGGKEANKVIEEKEFRVRMSHFPLGGVVENVEGDFMEHITIDWSL